MLDEVTSRCTHLQFKSYSYKKLGSLVSFSHLRFGILNLRSMSLLTCSSGRAQGQSKWFLRPDWITFCLYFKSKGCQIKLHLCAMGLDQKLILKLPSLDRASLPQVEMPLQRFLPSPFLDRSASQYSKSGIIRPFVWGRARQVEKERER